MSLTVSLVEAGLLQFGVFAQDGTDSPVRASLAMLPSYPDILRDVTRALAPRVPRVDHLLATPDAVPLGVALSLETGVPLVYSRGRGEAPVADLVGAYDIGHPALLLTNTLEDGDSTLNLIDSARTVGLETTRILCVLNLRARPPKAFPVTALLDMNDVIAELTAAEHLPERQGRAVRAWLNRGCTVCE